MKKIFLFVLALAVVFAAAAGYADDRDLATKGFHELEAITAPDGEADFIPVYDASANKVKKVYATFRGDIINNGRLNAYSTVASSSTNLAPSSLPYSVILKRIAGANGLDANPGTTLEDGIPGQILVLVASAMMDGGSWKVTPVTMTGFSYVTLDTKGDMITLQYFDDTMGWVVVGNSGATVTTPDIKQGL